MMKVLVAQTLEIDDVELAVDEILSQLDLATNALTYSAGLLTCYPEFIESGVLKAVCDALPFDVIGCTTLGCAVNGVNSQLMLSIQVLTSDDVRFSAAHSQPIATREQAPILREVYERAAEALGDTPSMMISFLPLLFNVGGDETIAMMDQVTGGLVNFGTVAVDHTTDYRYASTFLNGVCAKDAMAILLLAGDVQPKFLMASISPDRIIQQKAIITESQGNVLMGVNDMPIAAYMETLGLAKNGEIIGGNAIPFMIESGDGTPAIARTIFAQTPDGYAVCGGVMPVGSILSVGSIDYADVMRTTENLVLQALETEGARGMVMFSCIARFMALAMESDAELELTTGLVGDKIPFQFTYSGGEVCPVPDRSGKYVNRFHNDTLVICVF